VTEIPEHLRQRAEEARRKAMAKALEDRTGDYEFDHARQRWVRVRGEENIVPVRMDGLLTRATEYRRSAEESAAIARYAAEVTQERLNTPRRFRSSPVPTYLFIAALGTMLFLFGLIIGMAM